jgi:hypothetical protein
LPQRREGGDVLKYSLATLLGVVALTGLGCAAFVNYSEQWVHAMFAVVMAMLFLAGAVIAGGGKTRPFAVGFAAVGGAYFLLAFLMTPELREERLLTSRTIDWLHAVQQKAEAGNQSAKTGGMVGSSDAGMSGSMYVASSDASMYASSGDMSDYAGMMSGMGMGMPAGPVVHPAPRERQDIGHCLWALILGALAGALAQAIHQRAVRETPAR